MAGTSTHTLTCSSCGLTFEKEIFDLINVSDNPELKEKVISGEVFISECPHCGRKTVISSPLVYLDPKEMLLVVLSDNALSIDDTQGYTARLVTKAGELIEKVKIFDAGLDDIAIEMCKYVTRQELGKEVSLKFLRMDGADNEIILTYPQNSQMEMLSIGFNVYEDCCGIISRNPSVKDAAKGLVKIDEAWLGLFFA